MMFVSVESRSIAAQSHVELAADPSRELRLWQGQDIGQRRRLLAFCIARLRRLLRLLRRVVVRSHRLFSCLLARQRERIRRLVEATAYRGQPAYDSIGCGRTLRKIKIRRRPSPGTSTTRTRVAPPSL